MLSTPVDISASTPRQWDYVDPTTAKIAEDLDRYRQVIAATRPEVIVETGTWQGGSARWFAGQGVDVVTIDIRPPADGDPRVTWLTGDSADPATATAAARAVAGRRTMVVLDSDHSAAHVRAEITNFGPLVSPGCYLVVEDGIVRWLPEGGRAGSPLDAVEALLVDDPRWERDTVVEALHPVSMSPGGWWRRAS